MTAAPFVIAGWALTGAAIGAYALTLARRERRARRLLEREDGEA